MSDGESRLPKRRTLSEGFFLGTIGPDKAEQARILAIERSDPVVARLEEVAEVCGPQGCPTESVRETARPGSPEARRSGWMRSPDYRERDQEEAAISEAQDLLIRTMTERRTGDYIRIERISRDG